VERRIALAVRRGQRLLLRRGPGREDRGPLQVRHLHPERGLRQDRPLGPGGHQLRGPRRHPRPRLVRLAGRRLRLPLPPRAGDLRDARGLVRGGLGGLGGHLPLAGREARPLRAPRRQRRPAHARDGVRRRPVMGLQPRAHLRGGERLRWAGRSQDVRARGPQARHRGPPGRGLQPLRALRSRPVALRRLVRERQGRHLLLQRRPCVDPLGRDAARLRPSRGALLHQGERPHVVAGLPYRRPPLRHDRVHAQRGRPG